MKWVQNGPQDDAFTNFCLDSDLMHSSIVLNKNLPFQSKRNILFKKSRPIFVPSLVPTSSPVVLFFMILNLKKFVIP